MSYYYYNGGELYHYGVKGMKWGHRKARNDAVSVARAQYKAAKQQARSERKAAAATPEAKAARKAKLKKAAIIGGAAAGTALAAYGAYKLNKYVKTKNGEIAAKRGHEYAKKVFSGMQSSAQEMALHNPDIKSQSIRVSPSAHARSYAKTASDDNFRTAARNVMNYKRSGGSLRDLSSVASYNYLDDYIYEMRR